MKTAMGGVKEDFNSDRMAYEYYKQIYAYQLKPSMETAE